MERILRYIADKYRALINLFYGENSETTIMSEWAKVVLVRIEGKEIWNVLENGSIFIGSVGTLVDNRGRIYKVLDYKVEGRIYIDSEGNKETKYFYLLKLNKPARVGVNLKKATN